MAHSYIPRTDRPPTSVLAHPDCLLNFDIADVNRIPLDPRRRPATGRAQALQLRDDHLDPLILRTARAYDLVIHYDRDSNGGDRWSRKDINYIHHVGRYLHGDMRVLKRWKEVIAKEGQQDAVATDKICDDDDENVKKYCERILDVIRETERVPLRQHMTREGGCREESGYAGGVDRPAGQGQTG